MILIFLLIACVWLFGQFAFSVGALIGLGLIALYLLLALLNSKATSKFFSWATKNRTNSILSIVAIFLCCILIGVSIGASQLNDSDIDLQPVLWSTEETVLGTKYEDNYFGAFVTNNSNKTVSVNVKAEFYDKRGLRIKTSEGNWSGPIAPNGSTFVEINFPEKAETYKLSLAEQKKNNYRTAVIAGSSGDCDVIFSFDEKYNDMTVRNTTKYNIESCGCFYVYYNAKGEISYIQKFSAVDIPAGKRESKYFELDKPPVEYNKMEVFFYAFR